MSFRDTLKNIGNTAVEGGRYLISEFVTNKDTSRGIKDFDKYQEYSKQLENPYISQSDSETIQKKMIEEDIIDPNLYSNFLRNQQRKQAEQAEYNKNSQLETEKFRGSLVDSVRDNYVKGDSYQREVLNKAINELTDQYSMLSQNVHTTYDEFKDEGLIRKRNELRPEYEQLIRDSAKKYGEYINQGMDFNQAYRKLIQEGRDKADRIVQIQNQVRRKQDRSSGVIGSFVQANQAFGKGEIGTGLVKSVLGVFSTVSGLLNLAGEGVEEGKQLLLGGYDVLEELNNLNVYKDSSPILNQWRTLKSWGYEMLDGLPQLLPAIAALFIGNKASAVLKLDQVATSLLKGVRLADQAADVTRMGKFLSESMQDFFLLDAVAQPMIGRPMTTQDFLDNRAFNIPINMGIAALSRGAKMVDKAPQTFFKMYGIDPTRGATITKDYLDILSNADNSIEDSAMALFGEYRLRQSNKNRNLIDPTKMDELDSILTTALPKELQDKHAKVMEWFQEYNNRATKGEVTINDVMMNQVVKGMSTVEEFKQIGGNPLKEYMNRIKQVNGFMSNPDIAFKLINSSVVNLLKQGVVDTTTIKNIIETLPENTGTDIIKGIRGVDTTRYANAIKKINGSTLSAEVKADAFNQLYGAYHELANKVIDNLFQTKPTERWQIGSYVNMGDGTLRDIVTNKRLAREEVFKDKANRGLQSTAQQALRFSEVEMYYKNIDNIKPIEGLGYEFNVNYMTNYNKEPVDTLYWNKVLSDRSGTKSLFNSITSKFGIKYDKTTQKSYITRAGLDKLHDTLRKIYNDGWSLTNLSRDEMDAYRLLFMKKITYNAQSLKDIGGVPSEFKTWFEDLFSKDMEEAILPETKFQIDNKDLKVIEDGLKENNFEIVEQGAATIIAKDKIADKELTNKEISKAVTKKYPKSEQLQESIEGLLDIRSNLDIDIDKELGDVIGSIVSDYRTNVSILKQESQVAQEYVYTITLSKLLTKSDTVMAKIANKQTQWLMPLKNVSSDFKKLLQQSDVKIGAEINIGDKVINITNISNILEANKTLSNYEAFVEHQIKLKKELKHYYGASEVLITGNKDADKLMDLFIMGPLVNKVFPNINTVKAIKGKLYNFIRFVDQLDGKYKVYFSYDKSRIVGDKILIGHKDIEYLISNRLKQSPVYAYTSLFNALKKNINLKEARTEVALVKDEKVLSKLVKAIHTNIKESKEYFRKVLSATPLVNKFAEIEPLVVDMIDNGVTLSKRYELIKTIYSSSAIRDAENIFKELAGLKDNLELGIQSGLLLGKTDGLGDMIENTKPLLTDVTKIDETKVEKVLTYTKDKSNNAASSTTPADMKYKVMPITNSLFTNDLAKIQKNIDEGKPSAYIFSAYKADKEVQPRQLLQISSQRISPLLESLYGFIYKKYGKDLKTLKFGDVSIGKDIYDDRVSKGGNDFMGFDMYCVNRIVASVLSNQGDYSKEAVEALNILMDDKQVAYMLANIKGNKQDYTKNLIQKYIIENGLANTIDKKNISNDTVNSIYAYISRYIVNYEDMGTKEVEELLEGILMNIKSAIKKEGGLDLSEDLKELLDYGIADELSTATMADMIKSIVDKSFNETRLVFNPDLIKQETNPFSGLGHNMAAYGVIKDKILISTSNKLKEIGLSKAIDDGLINKATVTIGKDKLMFSKGAKPERELTLNSILTNVDNNKRITLEYITKDGSALEGVLDYKGLLDSTIGKQLLDDMGLPYIIKDGGKETRRITMQEVVQKARDLINESKLANPFKPKIYNDIDANLIKKINRLNISKIDWGNGYIGHDDWFSKLMTTKIKSYDTSKYSIDSIGYTPQPKSLKIEGVVPRFYKQDSSFNGSEADEIIGEAMGDGIIYSSDDIYKGIDVGDGESSVDYSHLLNTEADIYIVQVLDTQTGKRFIGTLGVNNKFTIQAELKNFNESKMLTEGRTFDSGQVKSLIDDINAKELLGNVEKNLSC